jgi:hypothetical protein
VCAVPTFDERMHETVVESSTRARVQEVSTTPHIVQEEVLHSVLTSQNQQEREMRAEKLKMMDQLKELTRRKQELLQQQIDKQKALLRLAEKVKPGLQPAGEPGVAPSPQARAPHSP